MATLEVSKQFTDRVLDWLSTQKRADHGSNVDTILDTFQELLQSKKFAINEEISEASQVHIEKIFKKGNHRKMFSRKMCSKLNGKVFFKHWPLKQTAVITEIVANSKKDNGILFTAVNYFETKGGYIYVVRHGIRFPTLYMFTGHFFDRLLERGYNNRDHAARMQAVFRILRYMDRPSAPGAIRPGAFICHKTRQAYMPAFGGLCLGVHHAYKSLPPAFEFYPASDEETSKHQREVFLFLTYVNKEKFVPEQLEFYNQLMELNKMPETKEEDFAS